MRKQLIKYIKEVVGFEIVIRQLSDNIKGKFPLYLKDEYHWYEAMLENRKCLFAILNDDSIPGISQIDKHFQKVRDLTGIPVIAVFNYLEAYNRKRLIEKKIAFVVPDKQLYIPELLIDLREYSTSVKKKKMVLSPMAQQIMILFILDKHSRLEIERLTFKRLAALLNTNPMSITRAVENLKNLEFIEIIGEKEKAIRFIADKGKLWTMAKERNAFIDPVSQRIFVDELPQNINLLHAYDSALTIYADINSSRQNCFAIEKSIFKALKKTNALVNENNYDGKYCIEVWKYNPLTIHELINENNNAVDPLSLLLCYKDTQDERVEMAIGQIENKYLW